MATAQRQRRSDGERTYQAIVRASAELATLEGLHGLSIARLADHVGISKSGLYAHFRSKEELQVVRPTEGEQTARGTLEALCERFFSHVERRVFPGGCFFAAASAEVDTHKGRVRDRISEFMLGWIDKLRDLVLAAQKEGTISPLEDPTQLAYELEAAMMLANNLFVLTNDPATLERGRRAVRRLLAQ